MCTLACATLAPQHTKTLTMPEKCQKRAISESEYGINTIKIWIAILWLLGKIFIQSASLQYIHIYICIHLSLSISISILIHTIDSFFAVTTNAECFNWQTLVRSLSFVWSLIYSVYIRFVRLFRLSLVGFLLLDSP